MGTQRTAARRRRKPAAAIPAIRFQNAPDVPGLSELPLNLRDSSRAAAARQGCAFLRGVKNGAVARDTREDGAPGIEGLGALALAVAGVGSRVAFVSLFPTQPFSDFQALVGFGLRLRDAGWAAPSWFWTQFNPGLPMILSILYRLSRRAAGPPPRAS